MPKKILLADDSITIQKVVELTFSEGDYQVFAVSNGSQALKKIQEIRPDIALLDVIMPETNGYEVCQQVKHDPATSRIPVLLLTGTFEPFDRKRADSVGADGHLTKPFESQVLISRVEELIATNSPAIPEPVADSESPVPVQVGSSSERVESLGAVPSREEEAILDRIVPDRYDELVSGERTLSFQEDEESLAVRSETEVSSQREGGAPPSSGFPSDAVADTWDELASGLSGAPASTAAPVRSIAAPETRVEASPQPVRAPLAPPPEDALSISGVALTAEQIDQVTSQVLEKLSDRVVREIAWEVIPEIAETLIRQRIRELEEKIAREG
jgi:CheY-like chemotaxis protein